MATKSRATTHGNYICKVGFYDIRQKTTQRKTKNGLKSETAKSEFVILHGKKLIKSGFNTKLAAIEGAKELSGETFREVYSL